MVSRKHSRHHFVDFLTRQLLMRESQHVTQVLGNGDDPARMEHQISFDSSVMRVENVHTSSLDLTHRVLESLHQVLRPFFHFLQSVGVLVEEPEVHHAERHQFQTLVELTQTQLNFLTEQSLVFSQFFGLLFQSLHLHEVVGEDLVKLSVLHSHLIQS